MLKHASEPELEWGPSRKQNQVGRYETITDTTAMPREDVYIHSSRENVNAAFDSSDDMRSRL